MRLATLSTIALLLASGSSCIMQELHTSGNDEGPIPQIERGAEPKDVVAILGTPENRSKGYWRSAGTRFDMEFTVWHYKEFGRVIFNRYGTVHDSQLDPKEEGRSKGLTSLPPEERE